MKNKYEFLGFIIDVDGVLIRGKTPLPGAVDFIEYLNSYRFNYVILTNNSTYTNVSLARFFHSQGMKISQRNIFTSAMAAGLYLIKNLKPKGKAYVIGSSALKSSIRKYGWYHSEDEKVDAVIVGLDRKFTYRKLKTAQNYILQGAVLIGTNPDTSFPAENGRVEPGGGSILRAVEAASGTSAIILGKPEGPLVKMALNYLNTHPSQTALIGDSVNTDVLSAKNNNLFSILVSTGVSSQIKDVFDKQNRPDLVVTDLYELIYLLEIGNKNKRVKK